MATQKLEYSLRLRHPTANLTTLTEKLGLKISVLWNKGDPKRNLDHSTGTGNHESSYCSLELPVLDTETLEVGLGECMNCLRPRSADLVAFVRTGGTASLAIGWFSGSVGGDSIPSQIVAELAKMAFTLDFYLYLSPSPADRVKEQ